MLVGGSTLSAFGRIVVIVDTERRAQRFDLMRRFAASPAAASRFDSQADELRRLADHLRKVMYGN